MVEHNILEDSLDVLGPGSFDLVCSRLMLFHLRGKQEQAIGQMVQCLRPGGWLVDEDADWGTSSVTIHHRTQREPPRTTSVRASCLADPSMWLMRELLHGCRGQKQ